MSENINIAIVDASITWRYILSSLLEKNNFLVQHKCNDEYELFESISISKIDIIILDINFNDKNGFDVISFLKEKLPKTPIIVYSLICEPTINQKLHSLGVIKCFHKNNFIELENELFDYFKLEKNQSTQKLNYLNKNEN